MDNKFSQYDSKDLNRKSATDILEKLRPIRQGVNKEFISRRLIWELIQNAKDNVVVCNDKAISDIKLNIVINLQQDKFIFSHNYGFFRNENVRGLIRRYSSSDKDIDREDNENRPSTTGRFGTGFMTTHLLSEIVTVEAVFCEDDVFSRFRLDLDRTGKDKNELIKGIEKAFESVEISLHHKKIIDEPKFETFKTYFIYKLNEEGFKLTKIAINELVKTAAISLINHPIINEIKYLTEEEECTLKIESDRVIEDFSDLNISIYKMKINSNVVNQYVSVKHEQVSIIIPVEIKDNQYRILSIDPSIPKIFLDFPLVGTEGLNIPFIINSSLFEPNEERDGISLSNHPDNDTKLNVKLLNDGFELFYRFIKEIQNHNDWLDMYNLFKFLSPSEKGWIDLNWYKNDILNNTKQKLLKVKAVENDKYGRIPLDLDNFSNFNKGSTVGLPYNSKEEKREKIWELATRTDQYILPQREYIHEWYEIEWIDKKYKIYIKDILAWASEKCNIEALSKSFYINNYSEIVLWLNDLLSLVNEETDLYNDINTNKIIILPNQLKEFTPKKNLFKSDGFIDENLKDILEILGEKCRQYLLLNEIKDFSNIILENKSQNDIIKSINEKINLSKPNDSSILDASNRLTNLIFEETEIPEVQKNLYEFSQILNVDREQIKIKTYSSDLWEKSNIIQIKRIIGELVKIGNINSLCERLGKEEPYCKNWLSRFITFLNENNEFEKELSLKGTKIFPNQNGNFCIKDELWLDDEIDEQLKNILESLGNKLREKLLDVSICFKLPKDRERDNEFVADAISKLITPKFSELTQTEENKLIFKSLFLWFNDNQEKAKSYFKDLFDNKHRLIDNEDIISSLEKAEELDKIYNGKASDDILEKIIEGNPDKIKNILNLLNDSKKEFTLENISQSLNEVNQRDEIIELHKDIYLDTSYTIKDSYISEDFPDGEKKDFGKKMLELLDKQDSQWKGYIYHFSHIMNIANILKGEKIKSRYRTGNFFDSAGVEIIERSKNEIKNFARFYFRPKTPTQWHNEGLGQNILAGNPICPIPIFLKFNLSEVIERNPERFYISNGNLSTSWAEHGNDYEFLKKFDYTNVYKEYPDPAYKQASQQEFIIENEFDFSSFNDFNIICRTENERCLLERIIDIKFASKIVIDSDYFWNNNALEIRKINHGLAILKNKAFKLEGKLNLNVILEDSEKFRVSGNNEFAIQTNKLRDYEVKYNDKLIYSTKALE